MIVAGTDDDWRRNLELYVRQRRFTSMLTYIPISLAYYLSRGLDLSQIGTLVSISAAVFVVIDLISGYTADKFGYKRLLAGGIIIQGLSFAVIGVSTTFGMLVVGHVVLGFGEACRRGSDDALARQSAVLLGEPDLIRTKYAPRNVANAGAAEATAALLVAGLAFAFGPIAAHIAMLLQPLPFMLAALTVIKMVEPPRVVVAPERGTSVRRVVVEHIRQFGQEVADEMRHNPKGRWLVFFAAAIGCTTQTAVYLVQPYFHEFDLSLWQQALLWAPYHYVWGLVAWFANKYAKWLGSDRLVLMSLVALAALANLGMAFSSFWWCILLFLPLFYVVRGLQMPTMQAWIGEIATPSRLATVFSLRTTVQWVAFVVMNQVLSLVTQVFGTGVAFVVSLVTYAVFGVIFLVLFLGAKAKS